MATKNIIEDEKMVAGIDTSSNPVKAEEDFVSGLLEAAGFINEEDKEREIEIKNKDGKVLFTFTVRPVSTEEFYAARKKGVKLIPNPVNKKLPKIEDENAFSTSTFHAWLIYTATIDADKERVWNNAQLKAKSGAILPVDNVKAVFKRMGDMNKIVDIIMEISGIGADEEEESIEITVKN